MAGGRSDGQNTMSKTEHLKKAGMARRENKIKNLFSKFFF
jgi:hypothetical protein